MDTQISRPRIRKLTGCWTVLRRSWAVLRRLAVRSSGTVRSCCSALLLSCWGLTGAVACSDNYRIGDYVLVDWCDGQYPGFITAQRGRTRYRVHFEGYDSRWDTDVTFQEIHGRLEEPPRPPPAMCAKVAIALGVLKQEGNTASPFREGARVKVTWRGSVYRATVVELVADRVKVHYDGTEAFLDEVIERSRIVESQ